MCLTKSFNDCEYLSVKRVSKVLNKKKSPFSYKNAPLDSKPLHFFNSVADQDDY